MPPLVSILIPAYNAERSITDTIESALAQTWPRKEIIIVDDGSRDRTLSVAQQFASGGVLVASQTNQGASAARNKAYELCQGDYIQWLDADDLLAPDKIERQMHAAEQSGDKAMLLSAAWGYFFWQPERAVFTPTRLWANLSPVEWLLRKMGEHLHMQTATWLTSRELAESAGPWDVKVSKDDDGEYFARVLLASTMIRFVPEARTFYRRSGFQSRTHLKRSELESHCRSMQLNIGYLRSLEESERVDAACLTYLQKRLHNFYPERPDLVEELRKIAANLGGELATPTLPWKYAWIQTVFGWAAAKAARQWLRGSKESLLRLWDKTLLYRG
jgi:glycosyltransferase involved in cell wall biosynthesis